MARTKAKLATLIASAAAYGFKRADEWEAKAETKAAWSNLFRFWIAKRRDGPIRQSVVELRFNAAKQTFYEETGK